jgi:hypothetical protein
VQKKESKFLPFKVQSVLQVFEKKAVKGKGDEKSIEK